MSEQSHKDKLAEVLAAGMNRRSFMKLMGSGAGLAAGSAILGGTLVQSAMAAAPKRGGTIKLAWIDAVDTLDPHFTASLGSVKILNNIFNGLLKVAYDGKKVSFVPDLAETWDMPDDKTHVFKLRKGVKFHNGDPCDAAAVKWSLERVKDPAVGSPHAWKFETLSGIDIVDESTLRMRFSKPYAFLPVALTGSTGRAGTIVSRRAVEQYGKAFGRNPVGTGPFKFAGWRENESITLERNPDYFEPGLPYLDGVQILLIKEPTAAVAAMMAGQVDGMSLSPFQFIPQLKANPKLKVYGEVEGNYSFVGMNNRRAPFDDPMLRKAVAAAIDRNTIVKQGYFGEAIPAFSCISPPMTGFYDKNIGKSGRGQRFDLKKAMEYRKQSKYQGEVNPVYIVSQGFTGSGGSGTRNSQLILPMLEKIGIKPKIELLDRAVWTKRRNGGDFDMYDEAWIADLDPDETIYPEWHSGKPWNFVGYSNKEFDKLLSEAQDTLNQATRKKLYDRAEDLLMADAPLAVLAHMKVFKILSKRVQGFQYIPVDLLNLHSVWLS
ncbi:ABC transporter substrate-binding protein [Thiobacillus sp.]|uniref:ABC transporter substrate-binding protein n=1 Tax=Thiobacillus sp. TaxID=924 RepID=UPI00286EB164|nr:ABC transporter substrate-binding protein [Thiobacillus sp.]